MKFKIYTERLLRYPSSDKVKVQRRWKELKGTVRPFLIRETLDETLDTGRIEIWGSELDTPIEPFTRVKIVVLDNKDKKLNEYIMLVYNSSVKRVRLATWSLYNHVLDLVELTKELERVSCENLAFSKSAKKRLIKYKAPGAPTIDNVYNLGNISSRLDFTEWEDYDNTEPGPLNGNDAGSITNFSMSIPGSRVLKKIRDITTEDHKDYIRECLNSWIDCAWSVATDNKHQIQDATYNYFNKDPHWAKQPIEFVKINELAGDELTCTLNVNLDDGNEGILTDLVQFKKESSSRQNEIKESIVNRINSAVGRIVNVAIYCNGLYRMVLRNSPNSNIATDWEFDEQFSFNVRQKGDKYVIEDIIPEDDYTVRSALERIVAIDGNYELDTESIPAGLPLPEFYFSSNSLWEVLYAIGGFIHAIPRLKSGSSKRGIITYDPINIKDKWSDSDATLISEERLQSGDMFFDTLESDVSNMSDSTQGIKGDGATIYEGAIKETIPITARDVGSVITTSNAVFRTKYPIFRIISAKINGKVDATPLIYEAREYVTLYDEVSESNSTQGILRYKQGDTVIDQLYHKPKKKSSIQWEPEATLDFIMKKSASDSERLKRWIEIEYIPYVSTRVRQVKYNGEIKESRNIMKFNQSAGTVESEAFGAQMKGVINRLGETLIERSYQLEEDDSSLKCGKALGHWKISTIAKQYDTNTLIVTLGLVNNFNKLSEHIALENSHRLYDISETHNIERHITYDHFIELSDSI